MHRQGTHVTNIALSAVMFAFASLGVLGWANQAWLFDALESGHGAGIAITRLNPLWPIFAVAALLCVAAQVLAAAMASNFVAMGRQTPGLRLGAVVIYLVGAVFSAYSAEVGVQTIMDAPHRAAHAARAEERAALTAEITTLEARISYARRPLDSLDPATTPTMRQEAALATFLASTESERARLDAARTELSRKPPLARQREQSAEFWPNPIFIAMLLWALIEPWGFPIGKGAARAGEAAPSERAPNKRSKLSTWRWILACLGIGSTLAAPAAAAPPEPPSPLTADAEAGAPNDQKAATVRSPRTVRLVSNPGGSGRYVDSRDLERAMKIMASRGEAISCRKVAKFLSTPQCKVSWSAVQRNPQFRALKSKWAVA